MLHDQKKQIGCFCINSLRRAIALLLCMTGLSASAFAQQGGKQITGTVLDETGASVIGANVVEKGTTNGVITDADGYFSLSIKENATLQVSYVGYITQEIVVGNRTDFQITLLEDTQALEEVVVVGYGTVRKRDLTGSVASIDSKSIIRQQASNVSQALRGQIAGLSVQQSNGKAAAESTVILRGQSAIGKTVQPLVIIDGIPSNWTIFNNLNANDVERIDVLKDASSTAIYGSRASGGVVIVTTRSPQEGKNVISYDGSVGIKALTRMPKMKNTQQLYQFVQDGLRIVGSTVDLTLNEEELRSIEEGIDTDWVGMVTRDALQTDHNLSLSGGSKNETHLMSVGYHKTDGNVKSDSYERYSLNLKATGSLFDKLTTGASVYAAFSTETGGDGNILGSAYRLRPWGKPKNEDGSDRFHPTPAESLFSNPLFDLKNSYDERKRTFANGSIFLEYKPIDGLLLKSNFMPSFYGERYGSYRGEMTMSNQGIAGSSTSSVANTWRFGYTWENTVSFNKTFDRHSIGLTALFSIESGRTENYNGSVKDLTYDNEYWYNFAASTSITGLTSGLTEEALESYMLRANYGLMDRYLLTLTGRWDGSSKLAPGYQWGFFPSAALAWRAGEEQFIKDLNVFSNLKFRASYGIAGNNAVSAYASWPRLSTTVYDFDGLAAKGAAAAMENKALEWEKSYEYNLGIDLGFFGERLTAAFDLYQKTTRDIILSRQVPSHQGVSSLSANVGSVLNKGVEATLASVNMNTKDFTWKTSLNFSTNHNEILDLYGNKKDDLGNKWFIGQPVTVSYDYKFIGIWQEEEAEEAAKYGEVPGKPKRLDNSNDGKYTSDDDYFILGNPFPTWTGGIINEFTYKNLDFSLFIYTRQGEFVSSGFHSSVAQDFSGRQNILDVEYWTPENRSNRWWRPETTTGVGYVNYMEVSFWRVGNITLGYRLPTKWLQKSGISNCRAHLTVNNPFVFTDYAGWDPEWPTAGFNSLPLSPTTCLLGLNLSF
jgi:TonB-linked SusC/RagA family outer membrane protein